MNNNSCPLEISHLKVMAEDEPEAEPRENAWVIEADGSDAEVDVVAVHGPEGQRRETWTFDHDPTVCWLSSVFGGRVMLYGYNTKDVFSPYATRQSIIRQAISLLESFHKLRDGAEVGRRPIVLVSHGLGGLLIKAAIVIATRDPSTYEWFTPAVRELLFFDYPHRVPDTKYLRQQIYRQMISIERNLTSPINLAAVAEVLPEIISEINGMFIQSKILVQAHVVNFIPSLNRDSEGPNLRATNLSTILAIPFESIIEVKNKHSAMTRLSNVEIDLLMSNSDGRSSISGTHVRGGIQEHALRTLSASASPIFPAPFTNSPTTIPELDNFVSAETDVFLHIQFPDRPAAELTDRICGYLRNAGANVVCFQFDVNDVRFSTLNTMLRTLIALMYNQIQDATRAEIEMLHYLHTTKAQSTQHLLEVLNDAMSYYYMIAKKNIYVLGGLDGCGEGAKAFISHITNMMTEQESCPRFIITTAEVERDFCSGLAQLPQYSFANILPENIAIRTETESDLTTLPRVENWRGSADLMPIFSRIADAYHQDENMLRILYRWLDWDRRPSNAIARDLLELKGHSPEHIFEAILSKMPPGWQQWAANLLCWVSLSFRPLWLEEIALISSMIHGSTAHTVSAAGILEWFNGLLQIEHGEVRLGHWRIRQWLFSTISPGWWQLQSPTEGHARIVKTCLLYLSGEHNLPSMTDWPAQHHFPYAVEFWPRHYEMVRGHEHLSSTVQPEIECLLSDSVCLNRWLDSYKVIADPFSNFEPDSSEALEIAAHFGFEELMEECQDNGTEYISNALIESAKCGHIQLVQRFLGSHEKEIRLDDPRLPKLLKIAASHNNQAVINEILNHIPSENSHPAIEYKWMSELLLQAVIIENESLVNRLLDLGADAHAVFGTESLGGVIDLASMSSALAIIRIFVNRGFDISPETGIGTPAIINRLGSWSNPETIKFLFEHGFRPQMVNAKGKGFLYHAATNGRYLNVDMLLELAPLEDYCSNASEAFQPLLGGAANGSWKCVEAMIKHNADLSVADEEGNALSKAAMNSDLRLAERLLQESAIDVDYCSDTAKAPIFRAINAGNPQKFVALLLEHGANIEIQEPGDWKRTPLLYAAARDLPQFTEVVRLFLEHNANIEARDTDGWTPLFTACCYGPPEMVQLLVDANADLYAICGEEKRTPLVAAIERPDVISMLLAAGVDPSKSFDDSVSPLVVAAEAGVPSAANLMLKQPLENKDVLPSALLSAVRQGTEQVVRQLLEMSTDVNHTNEDGASLLCLAVSRGDEAIVRTLMEFRPDLDCRDTEGNTVGHWISIFTPVGIVRLIANAGAKLDYANKSGRTPLISAVISCNWTVVRFLLSIKSVLRTINDADNWGTALNRLCLMNDPNSIEMMQLLVNSGADVDLKIRDPVGTALSSSCFWAGGYAPHDREQMVRYLVEECNARVHWSPPTATSPLHMACRSSHASIIRFLVAKGADPEAADNVGRKPLHLACYNSLSAVEALLDGREPPAQHDFTARDLLGRIPLHCAVVSGQLDLISHVLAKTIQAGLTIDTRDNEEWTPLLWAARKGTVFGWDDERHSDSAIEVIKMLLENNADPNARGCVPAYMDTGTWSAADIAAYHEASDLFEILEQNELPKERHGRRHKIGSDGDGFCDACYLSLRGMYWICQQCLDYHLCYKCYESLDRFHPHHEWIESGGEEEPSQLKDDSSQVLSTEFDGGQAAVGHSSEIGGEQDLIDYDMGVVTDESSEEVEDSPNEKDGDNALEMS